MVAVLRLEGLPFKATGDDIDDFFSESDIRVENVHLLLNRDLRPSGTGFVELSDESDTKTALQLSGKCIADTRRYVKIIKSDVVDILVISHITVNEVGNNVEIKTVFHGRQ